MLTNVPHIYSQNHWIPVTFPHNFPKIADFWSGKKTFVAILSKCKINVNVGHLKKNIWISLACAQQNLLKPHLTVHNDISTIYVDFYDCPSKHTLCVSLPSYICSWSH